MAEWVKLSTNIFDNQKIKFVRAQENGDTMTLFWVWLISRAGAINDQGCVYFTPSKPYTLKTLAMMTGFSETVIAEALELFQELDMLSVDEEGYINITGWEEHQNIEGLEKIKEQNRLRKQKQREKKTERDTSRDVTQECHVTECDTSRDVTQQNKNKNRIDKNKNIAAAETAAAAPGDSVVTLYESEIGLITPIIGEELHELENEVGELVVKQAIAEAAKSGGRTYKYVQAIANRLHSGRARPSKGAAMSYSEMANELYGQTS